MLYSILNQADCLLCDRAYFPGPDMAELLRKHGKPLFGVESRCGDGTRNGVHLVSYICAWEDGAVIRPADSAVPCVDPHPP